MNTARMRTREQQQCRLAKKLRNRNKKNQIRYYRKLAKTNKSYTSSPELDDGDKKLPAKKSVPASPKRGDGCLKLPSKTSVPLSPQKNHLRHHSHHQIRQEVTPLLLHCLRL